MSIIDKVPAIVKIYKKFGLIKPDKIDAASRRIHWNIGDLDAGEERVASDPFADLVIPTVEYDDIDAEVNDEVISAVLNEITSENLVDHVSDLLDKFYDQGAKAKEIGLLEVRFRGTRDDLVAEWKR